MKNIKEMIEERIYKLDDLITCKMVSNETQDEFIKLIDVYTELVKLYKSLD